MGVSTLRPTASWLLFATAARGALRRLGVWTPLTAVYRRMAFPVLGARPAGPLTDEACTALVAAAEALVGTEIDRARYEGFFRWRGETVPGHRALYEQFAATVNRLARRSHGRDFARCDNPVRLELLRPAFHVRTVRGRLDRLRTAVLRREWVLFDLHIVRQIALLFARTDAWRLVGYESWPGTPRGLERYREPRLSRQPAGGVRGA